MFYTMMGGGAAAAGFTINFSAEFDGSNDQFTHTWGAAGNLKKWTHAGWVQRLVTGHSVHEHYVFADAGNGTSQIYWGFYGTDQTPADTIHLQMQTTGDTSVIDWRSTATYTDTNWHHFAWTLDTTPATPIMKFWWDAVEVTAWTKTKDSLSQNDQFNWNNTQRHRVANSAHENLYSNVRFAQLINLDGVVITDPITDGLVAVGPVPADVSGLTFGTNGFHFDFEVSGDLANDVSGNNNDWTNSGAIQSSNTPSS